MNGFKCMLIKYPQRTQGQETVKTLQEKWGNTNCTL